MDKGVPFRMRFALALVIALVTAAFAAPMALAQSPDDIPGFDQLPIPGGGGGETPSETPTTDPGGGGGDTDTPQVDAPGGGVDTGAGGLAENSALPMVAATAVAAMGGAVLVARRRAAQR